MSTTYTSSSTAWTASNIVTSSNDPKPGIIGLDFETYGAESLPVHGLYRYVNHPSFVPIIAAVCKQGHLPTVIEFKDRNRAILQLWQQLGNHLIAAHNAGFERAVLQTLGINLPASRFIDSAAVSRAAGGGGGLEAAAPQLLGTDKMDAGKNLIRLFSIPTKEQLETGDIYFNPQVLDDHPDEYLQFKEYCALDAKLSLKLVTAYQHVLTANEAAYSAITMEMNSTGWHVDLGMVEEMQRRYLLNQAAALAEFQQQCDAVNLNLNSLKQLKAWCKERGVNASSFDEKHVAKLRSRLIDKVATSLPTDPKYAGYTEVLHMLTTKQVLGGSSLKKLQVIKDTELGGRLYDQYLHCGAGATWRTTGRSVQMQNLKRLTVIEDMEDLNDPAVEWDNDKLGRNLRQVFTASDRNGALIVGDFASVESRGLAWLAGEQWKLDAYRSGQDLYKVLASSMFGVRYDLVSKEQRQTGKVGELSCGYGAGAGAAVSFAEGMGVHLEEAEAAKLVWDWRDANPEIVKLWQMLDEMLHAVVNGGNTQPISLSDGMYITMAHITTPQSLLDMHPGAQSVLMQIHQNNGRIVMNRYFHGCHTRGRNICYYKPSDRKTGDLWRQSFIDPKTKQRKFYELYGGKLAGILTQSFCRELFFESLAKVSRWSKPLHQIQVVGQFHDEIVLDCGPGKAELTQACSALKGMMSQSSMAPSFPLAAEVKHDYRYTK